MKTAILLTAIFLMSCSCVLFAQYTLTITVETETIKEAGKVEEIIMDDLKKYSPEIDIKKNNTLTLDRSLLIGSYTDTLRTWMPSIPQYYRNSNGNVNYGGR